VSFVQQRSQERARLCVCGHTAEQHDHLGYAKRGVCGCHKDCGCFSFAIRLTDEQVEALLKKAIANEDIELVDLCETALKQVVEPGIKKRTLIAIARRAA
jgi:hypothetical protein